MSLPPRQLWRHTLTPREAEVLQQVALGLSNKQIAAQQNYSYQTVKFHMGNVLRKLGAANRVQAARWWWLNVETRAENHPAG